MAYNRDVDSGTAARYAGIRALALARLAEIDAGIPSDHPRIEVLRMLEMAEEGIQHNGRIADRCSEALRDPNRDECREKVKDPPKPRLLKPNCKNMHAMTPENTRISSRGYRLCVTCLRINMDKWNTIMRARRRGA